MKKLFLAFLATALLTGTSCKAMLRKWKWKSKNKTQVVIMFINKDSLLSFSGPADITTDDDNLTFFVEDNKPVSEWVKKANEVLADAVKKNKTPVLESDDQKQSLDKFRFEKIEDFFVIGNKGKQFLSPSKDMTIAKLKKDGKSFYGGAVHLHIDVSGELFGGKSKSNPKDELSGNNGSFLIEATLIPNKFLGIFGRKAYTRYIEIKTETDTTLKATKLKDIYAACKDIYDVKAANGRVLRVRCSVVHEPHPLASQKVWSGDIVIGSEGRSNGENTLDEIVLQAELEEVLCEVYFTPNYTKEKTTGVIALLLILSAVAYAVWYGYERYYTKAKKPRTRGIRLRRR